MPPTPELDDGGMYTRVSSSESLSGPEVRGNEHIQLQKEHYHDDVFVNFDAPKSFMTKLSASTASLSSSSASQILSQAFESACLLKKCQEGQCLKQRWGLMVTLCNFVLYFVCAGFLYCYTLLFVHLQQEFRSSAMETGWVGSMATGFTHFSTPLTNYLILRLQSTRLVVFLGVICCSISLVVSSFVPDIYYLYGTIGVLYGCGVNFALHSSLVLLLQYFPGRNCTRSVSVALLGTPVGLLVISQIMNAALNTMGWRATLRFFGTGIFVICSLCCVPLVPSPNADHVPIDEKAEKAEEKEETKKFLKVVASTDESIKVVLSNRDVEVTGKKEDRRLSTTSSMNSLKSFMTLTPVWLISGGFFLSALAQTFHIVNFVGHLHLIGLADHGAIMIMSLASGEITGKILLSIFGDKFPFPTVYLLAASNLACAVATIPVAVVTSVPALIALSAGLGVMRSGHLVLGTTVLVDFFGISRIYEATSAMMLSLGMGYLLGSVVMGMSYDYTGNYVISIIVASGLFSLSSILFLAVQLRRKWIRASYKRQLQKEFNSCAKPLPQQTVPILHPVDPAVIPKSETLIIEDIISVV